MARDPILQELATAPGLPAAALAEAAARAPELADELIGVIERAAAGRLTTPEEENLVFYGLHLLAAAREGRACLPFLRLLGRPEEEIDRLLGDSVTETLPGIAIGLFDGSEAARSALFALILDPGISEWVRAGLLRAMAFLASEGRIAREDALGLLHRFDGPGTLAPGDAAWWGWEDAVALLGVRELAPRVEAAWKDGRIPAEIAEPELFYATLEKAETDPGDLGRFEASGLGPIEDVVTSLAWIAGAKDRDPGPFADALLDPPAPMPARNPWRDVRRNDPCPCGSGRKAKRCCLRS